MEPRIYVQNTARQNEVCWRLWSCVKRCLCRVVRFFCWLYSFISSHCNDGKKTSTSKNQTSLPTGVAQRSEVDVFSGVCLFVCQFASVFVCPHDIFRTITLRTMKLGGQLHSARISPEFECQGQMSKVKVTGDKKRKTAESSLLTMHSRACAVGRTQEAATDDTIAWPLRVRGDGLRRWENQRMLSSFILTSARHIH